MGVAKIDPAEVMNRIKRHRAWVVAGEPEAGPAQADRLVLLDESISSIYATGAALSSAQIVRCDLSGSTFVGCDFSSALLIGSTLRGCRFISCEFRKAELTSADGMGANFSGSEMTRVDFTHANLRYADLTNCDMGWCWLIDTDLRFAVLENVNLGGARLSGTKLYNTRRFSVGLDRTVVKDVFVDENAEGPPRSGLDALDFLQRDK
jgi:uncharacterized protein YjbI with pentapeptide repeats